MLPQDRQDLFCIADPDTAEFRSTARSFLAHNSFLFFLRIFYCKIEHPKTAILRHYPSVPKTSADEVLPVSPPLCCCSLRRYTLPHDGCAGGTPPTLPARQTAHSYTERIRTKTIKNTTFLQHGRTGFSIKTRKNCHE